MSKPDGTSSSSSFGITTDDEKIDEILELFSELINERYAVVRLIDKGGMGFVFEAHDELLDRKVALKLFVGDFDSPDDMQFAYDLYLKESRIAASLNHPSVVSIFEVATFTRSPYKNPFIAMEYIDGASLAAKLKQGNIDVPLFVRIFLQIASALDYSHTRDKPVLHRDIKPKNILLGNRGRAVLIDFGLSRFLDGSATMAGAFKGVSAYMAPEILDAFFKQDADLATAANQPPADLYSLGATMYRALTGTNPVPGTVATQVMQNLREHTVQPPSKHNPDIPEDVDALVMQLLEKDPSERTPTAAEVSKQLRQLLLETADAKEIPVEEPFVADIVETAPVEQPAEPELDSEVLLPGSLTSSRPIKWLLLGALLLSVPLFIYLLEPPKWMTRERTVATKPVDKKAEVRPPPPIVEKREKVTEPPIIAMQPSKKFSPAKKVDGPKSMGDDLVVWSSKKNRPIKRNYLVSKGTIIKDLFLLEDIASDNLKKPIQAQLRVPLKALNKNRIILPRETIFWGRAKLLPDSKRIHIDFYQAITPSRRTIKIRGIALTEEGKKGMPGKKVTDKSSLITVPAYTPLQIFLQRGF